MNINVRKFASVPAIRERVPLWLSIHGPSGSGKTFSALRLATGVAAEVKGDIHVIDTEARRSLHYADDFKFSHVHFSAPFGSLDYLAAVRHCVAEGAACIIIDSASHEHEGQGGYLDTHDTELTRVAGDDPVRRARNNYGAFQKPSRQRREMVSGLLQTGTSIIWCFRSKEKTKPVRDSAGKTQIVELGWQPISGPDLLFEMIVSVLLLPRANGVPTWQSEHQAELAMMKLPARFQSLFATPAPLSEEIGASLARWAAGAQQARAEPLATSLSSATEPESFEASRSTTDFSTRELTIEEWDEKLAQATAQGTKGLQAAWSVVPTEIKRALKEKLDVKHKPVAKKFDSATTAET